MKNALAPWRQQEGVFIIGEIGVNHNGDLDKALEMIDVAADAGANAVKFQTFNAERLVTASAPKAAYQQRQDPDSQTQIEMLKRLELHTDDYKNIKRRAEEKGVLFMSTPFDEESADFLVELGVSLFKVSSGDLTHLRFLQHLARKSLPMIISTGMGTLSEVEDAVAAIRDAGAPELAILHCVSNYPAAPHEANLRAIETLSHAFGTAVGWSDHMEGSIVSIAAVARGAQIIEKHYTLDRSLPGPDHAASLEPEEFRRFVDALRTTEAALGSGVKAPSAAEQDVAKVARRSLTAAIDIPAGEIITADMISTRRPGDGLPPKREQEVLGRRAARMITAGSTIKWEDVGA